MLPDDLQSHQEPASAGLLVLTPKPEPESLKMSRKIRRLSKADINKVLNPTLTQQAVELALELHGKGEFQQPEKPYMFPHGRDGVETGGRFITMPAILGPPFGCAGLKWIAGFPSNLGRGLPRASGTILLSDINTGLPLAVMDAADISAARTGAAAAICHEWLGKSGPVTVAVFGAGPIAEATIKAMDDLKVPPNDFRIFDRDVQRAQNLADKLSRSGGPIVHAVEDALACVEGAEVVVTATTAKEPYIRREWLNDCRLVVALSFEDIEPEVMLSGKLVVDDWGQCCREEKPIHRLTKSGRLTREHLHAELGQVLLKQIPGRETDEELIYANLMGMAIEDLAVAWKVYKRAEAQGIGTLLDE